MSSTMKLTNLCKSLTQTMYFISLKWIKSFYSYLRPSGPPEYLFSLFLQSQALLLPPSDLFCMFSSLQIIHINKKHVPFLFSFFQKKTSKYYSYILLSLPLLAAYLPWNSSVQIQSPTHNQKSDLSLPLTWLLSIICHHWKNPAFSFLPYMLSWHSFSSQ